MLQKCVRFLFTHLLSPLGLILIPTETFKNSQRSIEIQLFWDIIEVMAQAASQSRAAAAATVKESIHVLERYIQRDNLSQRLLQTKLDKLTADRDDLVAKHYVYGDKSNLSYESDEMLQWITPILDSAIDIYDEAFLKLETL